ncbi:MAG: hypothetical protein ACRCZF_10820 [Gemmataceae bacterium]
MKKEIDDESFLGLALDRQRLHRRRAARRGSADRGRDGSCSKHDNSEQL